MEAKVYTKSNGYQVHFKKYSTVFKDIKDAKEKAFELNFNFFSENKDKLPKGITLDISEKRFRLHIRLNHENIKHIKSSKDLSLLIDIRKHILLNLLDLF